MYKAFKYRLYPTGEQIVLLNKHFGCCRFVYNYEIVSERTPVFRRESMSTTRN